MHTEDIFYHRYLIIFVLLNYLEEMYSTKFNTVSIYFCRTNVSGSNSAMNALATYLNDKLSTLSTIKLLSLSLFFDSKSDVIERC